MFVFALYDIFYKFAIAEVLYNTAVLFYVIDNFDNSDFSSVNFNLKNNYLVESKFPRIFKNYISNYNTKINAYINTRITDCKDFDTKTVLSELSEELIILGIFVMIPKINLLMHEDKLLNPQCESVMILNPNTPQNLSDKFKNIVKNIIESVDNVNLGFDILKDMFDEL